MNLLEVKYKLYLSLLPTVQDKFGFIESDTGDSLLFTCLTACTLPNTAVGIYTAYNKVDNTWHRRPINPVTKCCGCWDPDREENQVPFSYKLKEAAGEIWTDKSIDSSKLKKILSYKGSTISRDMLLGLAWYAWVHKRLDISESVIKRALSHKGVMGKGDPWRINIMPALLSTFCWISYKLGGPSRPLLRMIPLSQSKKLTGFQAHLSVLHILLRQELEGKISSSNKAVLEHHAIRQPRNPLFHIAVRDMQSAAMCLESEYLWPSDRLPTAKDRDAHWLIQRDEGEDWNPSKENRTHSGGDFLFCYWLMQRYLDN